MGNDTDIRLKADRAFVRYLSSITGKSASSLAVGAGMAATTLNRFISNKAKPTSTLKDLTIEKIARRWGLDFLELSAYRKEIEKALRDGKPIPGIDREQVKPAPFRRVSRPTGLKEPPAFRSFEGPPRDPLMDQIMGAAYEAWFASYRETVNFERLPDLARLFYTRAKSGSKTPTLPEIKKRISDMLAVAAMESVKKK